MLKGVVTNLLGDAPLGDGSRLQEAKTRSKGPRDVETTPVKEPSA